MKEAIFKTDWTGYQKMSCDLEAHLYHDRRIEKNTSTAALDLGAAIHCGLAEFYRGKDADAQDKAVSDYIAANPIDPMDWRCEAIALAAMKEFRRKRSPKEWEVLQVEKPFACWLGKVETRETRWDVIWTGVIDLVVKVDGSIWLVDHKTASRLGPTWWEKWSLSGQFMGYKWALAQPNTMGIAARGAYVNAIGLRKPTPTGKAVEVYDPHPYLYSDDQVKDWQTAALLRIQAYLQRREDGVFPQNFAVCSREYGRCDYWEHCCLPNRDHRERILRTGEFRTVTWDPLKGHEGGGE